MFNLLSLKKKISRRCVTSVYMKFGASSAASLKHGSSVSVCGQLCKCLFDNNCLNFKMYIGDYSGSINKNLTHSQFEKYRQKLEFF